MPSGSGQYFEALAVILDAAASRSPLERLTAQLIARYDISNQKTARSYVDVAATLGLVSLDYQRVTLTESGSRAMSGSLTAQVASALVQHVSGCAEILEVLQGGPQLLRNIRSRLEERGIEWKTSSQIRYRLRWMEECGMVKRGGGGPQVWYELNDEINLPVA